MISILGSSDNLKVEGYDGKNVIIEAEVVGEYKTPEKAQGLKMVTPGGVDNTGMSATVKETTNSLITGLNKEGKPLAENVRLLEITLTNTKQLFKNYVIKVPRKVNVVFKEDNRNWINNVDGVVSFSGLASELDVNCNSCFIDVSDFRGNLIANSSFGKGIKVEFTELLQERVSSIRSNQGDIEVILPSNTKANLKLNAGEGNIFTDFDLEKAVVKDSWSGTGFGQGKTVTVIGRPSYLTTSGEVTVLDGTAQIFNDFQSKAGSKGEGASKALNRYNFSLTSKLNTDRYDYTINGGGVYMSVNSAFGGNIYLKKK